MNGIDAETGKRLSGLDHLRQAGAPVGFRSAQPNLQYLNLLYRDLKNGGYCCLCIIPIVALVLMGVGLLYLSLVEPPAPTNSSKPYVSTEATK